MSYSFGYFMKDIGGGIGNIVGAPFDAMKDNSKNPVEPLVGN